MTDDVRGFINVDVDIVFASVADRHVVDAALKPAGVSALTADDDALVVTYELDDPEHRTCAAIGARLLDAFEQVPASAAAALSRAELVFDIGHDGVDVRSVVVIPPPMQRVARLGGGLTTTVYDRAR